MLFSVYAGAILIFFASIFDMFSIVLLNQMAILF